MDVSDECRMNRCRRTEKEKREHDACAVEGRSESGLAGNGGPWAGLDGGERLNGR